MMMRGDIHYIADIGTTIGSEQNAGRPAVIVSNDACNAHSAVVEVVYLTTRPKSELPTHVTIRSASKVSIALCEQISSVSVERIGDYAGTCTEQEMKAMEAAMLVSLALDMPTVKDNTPKPAEDASLVADLRRKLAQAQIERDTYKTMYDEIISNILDRRTQ